MQCRIEDVSVGDIINRDPDGLRGWFLVAHISTLFNGEVQLADESQNESVSGGQFDVIGLQLIEELGLDDDTGFVSPPEPVQVAAPVQLAAPQVPAATAPAPVATATPATPDPVPVATEPVDPDPVPVDAADPEPVAVAESEPVPVAAAPEPEPPAPEPPAPEPPEAVPEPPEPAPSPQVQPDVQPEETLEVADPVGLNFRSAADIDLGKLAAALDGLDVGQETYALTFEPSSTALATPAAAVAEPPAEPPAERLPSPADEQAEPADPGAGARRSTDPSSVTWARRSPDLPPVPMPEGAVPVYGDTLPDSPSYLNPVVVREPGAAALPKRRGRGG